MANFLQYDPATGNGKQVIYSANTPEYDGKPGYFKNPDKALTETVPAEYIKVDAGALREMTAPEKAAVDAAKPPPYVDPDTRQDATLADHETRIKKLET